MIQTSLLKYQERGKGRDIGPTYLSTYPVIYLWRLLNLAIGPEPSLFLGGLQNLGKVSLQLIV